MPGVGSSFLQATIGTAGNSSGWELHDGVVPIEVTVSVKPALRQKRSNWCWAACGVMILRFTFGFNRRQCNLVNVLYDRPENNGACDSVDDPAEFNNSAFNQGQRSLEDAVNRFLQQQGRAPGLSIIEGTLSLSQVAQQLVNNKRLVAVRIEWAPNQGHFIILAGVNRVTNEVRVIDPMEGNLKTIDYKTLLNRYSTVGGSAIGKWSHTYY